MTRRRTTPRLIRALSVIALSALAARSAPAQSEGEAAVAALERSVVDVIARVERSVVAIEQAAPNAAAGVAPPDPLERLEELRRRRAGQPAAANPLAGLRQRAAGAPPSVRGAGVVIGDGLVLTPYLTVRAGESYSITTVDGHRHDATITGSDPRSGLAVLSFESGGDESPPVLPIGKAEELQKGRFVVAVGNPFAIRSDGQPTASWGVVTNTAQKAPAAENLNNVPDVEGTYRTTLHHFGSLIQTDARLGWGAGGGALVALDGRLVGVTTTTATIAGHERPAGYAIPMNAVVRRVVDALSEGRSPEYGLLGLTFNRSPVTAQASGKPAIAVSATFRGGPAANAGLRAGDLVLSIDQRPTPDADSLQLIVSSLPPGTPTRVAFERAGAAEETTLTLGKAYVDGERVVTASAPTWRGMRIDFPTAVPGGALQVAANEGRIDPEGCVVVAEVERGSAAWTSGVRPYDYISHVGGERVASPAEFFAAVEGQPDSVNVRFTKPLAESVEGAAAARFGPPKPAGAIPPRFAPAQGRERLFQELEKLVEPLDERDVWDPFAEDAPED